MPEWDEIDLTERERELQKELAGLSRTLRAAVGSREEKADPAFVMALRARLVESEPVRLDTRFQQRLRTRLVGRRIRFPWILRAALGAATAAAVLLLLVLHPGAGSRPKGQLAVGIPLPTTNDLTRGYPPPGPVGGGGGVIAPVTSRAEAPASGGYPTRLHLTAQSLPTTSSTVSVYTLGTRAFSKTSLASEAHGLGISGGSICMSAATAAQTPCAANAWRVIAQHLFPSRKPLQSLASSPVGELIYHDLTYDQFAYRGSPLPHSRAVAVASAWLQRLGWPASQAPVLAVARVATTGPLDAGSPVAVTFGWNGGVRATVPAATLWVAPTGRIVEAHVWPAVVRSRTVATRNMSNAWTQVESGKAPVAVEGPVIYPAPSGTGSARTVEIVNVLVTPARGHAYLEPAYRFSGQVQLGGGQGTHRWYALAPALAR
jgi:hypothetical protein